MKWEFNHDLKEDILENYEEVNITGICFKNEVLEKKELKFITLREVIFSNCKFVSVIFDNVFLTKVEFRNCEFLNCNFNESNLSKVRFLNTKFTNVSFFEIKGQDTLISEGIMQYSKIENGELDNSKFDGISFRENIFRRNKFNKIEFFKCEFREDKFMDTVCKNNDFRTSHFEGVSINIDDLITSKLSMLNIIEIVTDKGIILED